MFTTILFPSAYGEINQIDEEFVREYEAVCENDALHPILFGFDDWVTENRLRLSEKPETDIRAVYRGWMMQPGQYRDFFERLSKRRIHLLTTPEMYERMHMFPLIYPQIQEDTAKILTFPLHTKIDVEQLKGTFRRFMVKDYVKSVKGTEFPAFFDETVSQEEFDRWMEVFYHYRANLLTGGICVKEYLSLKRYGGKTNEYRVFYFQNEILSVCRNSLQGNYTPEVPMELIRKWQGLDSVFYTIDYAELEDGTWKIIETGDGSVSGLSDGQDARSFFRKLYICGMEERAKEMQ
ncbi:MAG: ATP-grasp domain-containing protein [Clostridia bacterium]|nr:ATP-grasp domain-containing protein [Clostridia bacterium]